MAVKSFITLALLVQTLEHILPTPKLQKIFCFVCIGPTLGNFIVGVFSVYLFYDDHLEVFLHYFSKTIV